MQMALMWSSMLQQLNKLLRTCSISKGSAIGTQWDDNWCHVWFGRNSHIVSINIGGVYCNWVKSMIAPGIIIRGNLSWDDPDKKGIKKGEKTQHQFLFAKKFLIEAKFSKAASALYYSTMFYCSSDWYQYHNIKWCFQTKFESLYFRLLRMATKDYSLQLSRNGFTTRCKQATPWHFANYVTACYVIKTVNAYEPSY